MVSTIARNTTISGCAVSRPPRVRGCVDPCDELGASSRVPRRRRREGTAAAAKQSDVAALTARSALTTIGVRCDGGCARHRRSRSHRLRAPPSSPGRRPSRRPSGARRARGFRRRALGSRRPAPSMPPGWRASTRSSTSPAPASATRSGPRRASSSSSTAAPGAPTCSLARWPASPARRGCCSRGRRWATTATGAHETLTEESPAGRRLPGPGVRRLGGRHRAGGGGRDPRGPPSAPASSWPPTAARSTACCLPFKLGLGGRIGSGEQYLSWIALDDHVGAILPPADRRRRCTAPVNLTAPEPGDQRRVHARRSAPRCTDRRCCRRRCCRSRRCTAASSSSAARRRTTRAPARARASGYTFAHPTLDERVARGVGSTGCGVTLRRSRVRAWGDRGVSNPRPPGPQPGALAN